MTARNFFEMTKEEETKLAYKTKKEPPVLSKEDQEKVTRQLIIFKHYINR